LEDMTVWLNSMFKKILELGNIADQKKKSTPSKPLSSTTTTPAQTPAKPTTTTTAPV